MSKKWLPIESSPSVMNEYLRALGIPEPNVEFCDVFGLDPELLAFVPRPIRAMILLYPITKKMDADDLAISKKQTEEIKEFMLKNKTFFAKQTIGNACGTMAILHAVMNNLDCVGDVRKDSPIDLLIKDGLNESPEKRAELIESSSNLSEAHMKASEAGVSQNQPIDADIDLHFTCFVHIKDRCVELDGRKPSPLLYGSCTDNDEFVKAAAEAIQEKISREEGSLRFSIISLSDKSQ